MGHYRVAIDTGATVTDVVAYRGDAGTYAAVESSTTPHLRIIVTGVAGDLNDIAMTPEYRKKPAAFGAEIAPELEKTGPRFNAGIDD